ncbi:MAG: hypothetical protein K8M05_20570 [Deltaproteobacteria bacterium]|nr:hypothetical protein [Kofleriaceae bacterium]
MSRFRAAYADATASAAAQGGAAAGERYVQEVEAELDRLLTAMRSLPTNCPVDFLKGFVAEVHHAHTLAVDAARQQVDMTVEVPQSTVRGAPDVVVRHSGGDSTAQLKYYGNAAETAKAQSDPMYRSTSHKVVPSDQLEEVRRAAELRAGRLEHHRPEQAAELRHTAATASDRIAEGEASSRPLSEPEARQIAHELKNGELDPRAHGYTAAQTIKLGDLATEAGTAALMGAVVTATLRMAPHAGSALLELFRNGKIDPKTLDDLRDAAKQGAAAGALRGAIAGALSTACRAGLLGEAMRNVSGAAIGAGTAVAISVIADAFKLGRGQIDGSEFAIRTTRSVVVGVAAYQGAALGQVLIPIPVLGAAIGGFLGSTLGAFGYEGARRALVVVSNEANWLGHVELAEGIASLARMSVEVAESTAVLVRVSRDAEEALAKAAHGWQRSRDQTTRLLAETAVTNRETSVALASLNERLARLKQ